MALYGVPIKAPGKVVVVMVNGEAGGPTVMARAWLVAELPAASVTLKVNEPLPPPVGVPPIIPEVGIKIIPGGRVGVTLHVYGLVPPDTVSGWL